MCALCFVYVHMRGVAGRIWDRWGGILRQGTIGEYVLENWTWEGGAVHLYHRDDGAYRLLARSDTRVESDGEGGEGWMNGVNEEREWHHDSVV